MLRRSLFAHLSSHRSLARGLAMLVCGTALTITTAGCKPKDEPPEVMSVEGRVESFKVADNGGEITVAYFNEKQQQEMIGTAKVTEQTEIMINGAAAKLSDLRNGERVRGDVRVEKRGDQRVLTALKIHAERPVAAPESQPAKPGEQPAPTGQPAPDQEGGGGQ